MIYNIKIFYFKNRFTQKEKFMIFKGKKDRNFLSLPFWLEKLKKIFVLRKIRITRENNIKILTFNIHYNEKEKKGFQENGWKTRKKLVASVIHFHNVDLIGFQEPIKEQIAALQPFLIDYDWYGIGLEDGKNQGPFNAIFYRKERFVLLDSSFFYLSPNSTNPSKGWDAHFYRGVTWVKLMDKKSKQIFYFFNTHFDYHGEEARNKSAILLRQKIKEIVRDIPFIVVGDFNIFPELRGEETYRLLTKKNGGKRLYDAQKRALYPHHGPTGSWSGFKEAGQPGIKPDYIFVDKNIQVITHGILSDTFDGKFPSDHLPILAEIIF